MRHVPIYHEAYTVCEKACTKCANCHQVLEGEFTTGDMDAECPYLPAPEPTAMRQAFEDCIEWAKDKGRDLAESAEIVGTFVL